MAQAAKPTVKANNFIFVDPFTGADAFPRAAPSRASAGCIGNSQMSRSPRQERRDIGGVALTFIQTRLG
jgi:hypothetical protein